MALDPESFLRQLSVASAKLARSWIASFCISASPLRWGHLNRIKNPKGSHGAWRCRHLKVSGGANIEQCFILAAFNFWPFFGKCHWKEPKFIFMHIFNYWKFLWHVFRFFWKFLWKLFNYWEIIAVKMECWTSLIFIYLKYSSLFKKCFWKLFLDNKINLMFPVKLNKVLLL